VLSARDTVVFVLDNPDYTTAERVAGSINAAFGNDTARAHDAASVEVKVTSAERDKLVSFLKRVENLSVEPDIRARVIVNERTGTVISGGDARISKVMIAHGDLKVSVTTDNLVSQPILVSRTGPGVRTEVVSNTRIDVTESPGVTIEANNTVADLVSALSKIKTSTRDMISILQGIKAAGALHAELVIQ